MILSGAAYVFYVHSVIILDVIRLQWQDTAGTFPLIFQGLATLLPPVLTLNVTSSESLSLVAPSPSLFITVNNYGFICLLPVFLVRLWTTQRQQPRLLYSAAGLRHRPGAWHTLHMSFGWMNGQTSELLSGQFPKGSEETADLIMWSREGCITFGLR